MGPPPPHRARRAPANYPSPKLRIRLPPRNARLAGRRRLPDVNVLDLTSYQHAARSAPPGRRPGRPPPEESAMCWPAGLRGVPRAACGASGVASPPLFACHLPGWRPAKAACIRPGRGPGPCGASGPRGRSAPCSALALGGGAAAPDGPRPSAGKPIVGNCRARRPPPPAARAGRGPGAWRAWAPGPRRARGRPAHPRGPLNRRGRPGRAPDPPAGGPPPPAHAPAPRAPRPPRGGPGGPPPCPPRAPPPPPRPRPPRAPRGPPPPPPGGVRPTETMKLDSADVREVPYRWGGRVGPVRVLGVSPIVWVRQEG